MVRLHSLSYSPWSEKARWALLHHGVPFEEREYVPIFGALPLRLLAGVHGRLSVPLLRTDDGAVVDSCRIAQWADGCGSGAPLFPTAHIEAILAWNAQADAAISAGRALVVHRIGTDPAALRESLPSLFPAWTRRAATPLARTGVGFIRAKWGVDLDEAGAVAALRAHADRVRAALAGGRRTLLDDFTFADIAVAASLQCIAPVADRFVPIGPATRRLWTRDDLAAEYADLLAWRDATYATFRPLPPSLEPTR